MELLKNKTIIKVQVTGYMGHENYYLRFCAKDEIGVYDFLDDIYELFSWNVHKFITFWQRVAYDDRPDSVPELVEEDRWQTIRLEKRHNGNRRLAFTAPCGQTVLIDLEEARRMIDALVKLPDFVKEVK